MRSRVDVEPDARLPRQRNPDGDRFRIQTANDRAGVVNDERDVMTDSERSPLTLPRTSHRFGLARRRE
jgi:hypothetical protein